MQNPRSILPVALVSGLIGGGVAVGAVTAFDLGGSNTKTVVQQAPLATADASQKKSAGLTPRDIYDRDAPGVAYITAQIVQRTASPFDFGLPQEQQGTSTGSGFVIDKDGTIATNAHVVDGATRVSVRFGDGAAHPAKILGVDKSTDLALLKIDPKGVDLHPLPLGSSHGIQVGDPTVAIGNPFGLDRTLTTGVVSALQRHIKAPNGFTIDNVIQTDAAINPGNSGGPLIDATGKVIGINSQIETGSNGNGNVGIGFAIPIDTVKQKIGTLKKTGTIKYAYLGVSTQTIDSSFAGLLPVKNGALVQTVTAGSPAAKAGLQGGDITAQVGGTPVALGGDIITKCDNQTITSADDLSSLVGRHKAGDKVKITFIRDRKTKTVEVTLGTRPASLSADQQPSQTP
ncbi:MAG TPA: trypsin-like peptidase domain-containing protein [Solirubrobacteraceae bacterium]|jgi:S1-C subfamily serine protease|nr:trypsin-like peptidase domain-containing protein [Solirubrobacteraceae bacterium]